MEQMTEEEAAVHFTPDEIDAFKTLVSSMYGQRMGMMLAFYQGNRVCVIVDQAANDGEQAIVTPLAIIYAGWMDKDILDYNKQPMNRITGSAH
jgi:hypothetical protein